MSLSIAGMVWPHPDDVAEGALCAVVTAPVRTGSGVSLGFSVFGADVWDSAMVQALGSLLEPVPVVSSARPDLDGWYLVEGVGVDEGALWETGEFTAQVSLRRLGPQVRVVAQAHGAVAPNDHGLSVVDSECRGWVSVPNAVGGYDGPGWTPVVSESGSVRRTSLADLATGSPTQMAGQVAASAALAGACTVEALVGGVWRPVIGRDLPAGVTRLRVGNGRVRATIPSGVGAPAPVQVQWWDDVTDAWLAVFPVDMAGVIAQGPFEVLAVSRVSATIRVHADSGSGGRTILDVSVRRGDVNVSVVAKSAVARTWTLDAGTPASTLADSRGVGYTSGSNTAVSVPAAWGFTGDDIVSTATAQVWRFGVGMAIGGDLTGGDEVSGAYYAQWWPSELIR